MVLLHPSDAAWAHKTLRTDTRNCFHYSCLGNRVDIPAAALFTRQMTSTPAKWSRTKQGLLNMQVNEDLRNPERIVNFRTRLSASRPTDAVILRIFALAGSLGASRDKGIVQNAQPFTCSFHDKKVSVSAAARDSHPVRPSSRCSAAQYPLIDAF